MRQIRNLLLLRKVGFTTRNAEILEALMVICFGLSWPTSIIKSLRSRSTKGKSLLFMIFIDIGYIFGIVGKILGGNITYVFIFYVLNFFMVLTDIFLYLRNRASEK